MIHEFHTYDSPERPGYEPEHGAMAWKFSFPLDGDDELKITMGEQTRKDFIAILNEESIDNAIQEAVDHGSS